MIDPALNLSVPTQKFLSHALRTSDLSALPLAGDASSRHYYRIIHEDQSWVLMSWEPFQDDGSYPFLSVQRHFYKHEVHVPQVVGRSPELGLILLEDLGDLTLERKFWENQNQQLVVPFYKLAIDELIKIHYLCSSDQSPCTAFQVAFTADRLLWEMDYGREHLLEKLCSIALKPKERTEIDRVFQSVCETLAKEPRFICHRDYHSRNLMLKLGRMRVIDFQDARMGCVQYDLVSLLRDAYVSLQPDVAGELVGYYLQQRSMYKPEPVSMDHFTEIYELQSIQRCFKAAGSFASFYNNRQDKRYLKYLPGALRHVKNALEKFPRFESFYSILNDNGLLEETFERP